jgi:hypothetical protein
MQIIDRAKMARNRKEIARIKVSFMFASPTNIPSTFQDFNARSAVGPEGPGLHLTPQEVLLSSTSSSSCSKRRSHSMHVSRMLLLLTQHTHTGSFWKAPLIILPACPLRHTDGLHAGPVQHGRGGEKKANSEREK